LNERFKDKKPYEEDLDALIFEINDEIKLQQVNEDKVVLQQQTNAAKLAFSLGFFEESSRITQEDGDYITYSFVEPSSIL
jgi:hypothetical protein